MRMRPIHYDLDDDLDDDLFLALHYKRIATNVFSTATGNPAPPYFWRFLMRLMNVSKTVFLSHKPYQFASFDGYGLFEHPTRGDGAAIIMTTPNGDVIETCFWDMDDFNSAGLDLCIEIDTDTEGTLLNGEVNFSLFQESNSERGL